MRNKSKVKFKLFISVIAVTFILFLFLSSAVVRAIARGYASSDTGLQTGMMVALSVAETNNPSVERATQENSSRIVGVITTLDNSLVSVSSGNSKVLVESEGQVKAYVSDINGPVVKGDQLVLSPLKGILMKIGDVPTTVLGIAADSPTEPTSYNYKNGNDTKDTKISKIKINLNNQGGNNQTGTKSDSALAKLGKTVSGKDISEIRVLAALILFVIVLIAEGAIKIGRASCRERV